VAELEWALLSYRVPREPSTPRIAVWRKLQRLGVVQVVDGLVAAPAGPESVERLQWIAEDVVAAGGEARVWLARILSRGEARDLKERLIAQAASDYIALIEEAQAAAKDDFEPDRRRTYARLRRELQRIRKRDHFPGQGSERAEAALRALAATLDPAKVRTT
jgi:hypothetical protein